MAFTLPNLSYEYSALEPYVDAQTMEIHHSKHHAKYVATLNPALGKFDATDDIVLLNKQCGTAAIPQDIATTVRNNAGGHFNHSFFWSVLAPPSTTNGPSAELKAALDSSFGSIDEMKAKFNAAAAGRFGSGWAWLGYSEGDGKLVVTSTPNQDNPLMASLVDTPAIPILGLDVWEHAYYLKYQNKRPEYIAAFWNVVNWEAVNAYYTAAQKGVVAKM